MRGKWIGLILAVAAVVCADPIEIVRPFHLLNAQTCVVRDIIQTPDNKVWLAVWGGGLACWDGVEQRIYDASSGLIDNSARTLEHDGQGGLWIGTRLGISHFDGSEFVNFNSKTQPEFTADSVYCIKRLQNNEVWFGMNDGNILIWKPASGTSNSNQNFHFDPKQGSWSVIEFKEFAKGNSIRDIHESKSGEIWLAIDGAGAVRRVGDKWTYFTEKDGLNTKLFSICELNDGTIIMSGRIAQRFVDGHWESIPDDGRGCIYMLQTTSGRIYSGTTNGLFENNQGEWRVISFGSETPRPRIEAITQLRDGTVWIGTQEGAFRISKSPWSVFLNAPQNVDLLGDTFCIPDNRGPVILGNDNILYRFAGNHWHPILQVRDVQGNVQETAADGEGTMWILYSECLAEISLVEPIVHKIMPLPSYTLPRGLICTSKKELWLRGRDGLFRFKDGEWQPEPQIPSHERVTVHNLAEGPDGSLWLGMDGRLERWKDGNFSEIKLHELLRGTIGFTSICCTRSGDVWISTSGNGVFRYRGGDWQRFTIRDGLVSNNIQSLFEDSQGTIWVGSRYSGASSYHEDEEGNGRWVKFTPKDGIREGRIQLIREYPNGTLWFAYAGIGVSLYQHDLDPPVAKIENAPNHLLPNGMGVFSFSARDLWNLTQRDELVYSYRIVPYSDSGQPVSWSPFTENQTALVGPLDPGRYRFEVRAADKDRNINIEPATVDFEVMPHFWLTPWFILPVLVLSLIAIVAIFHGIRKHSALLRSEEKYRDLVDDALTVIIKWDTNGTITFWNECAERVFGHLQAGVLGKNIIGTIFCDELTSYETILRLTEKALAERKAPQQHRTTNIRNDGIPIHIDWILRPVLDDQNKLEEIHAIGIDVTEKQRAEEALQAQEENFRKFCDSAIAGIFRCKRNGEIIYANDAFAQITGYQYGHELVGLNTIEYWHNKKQRDEYLALLDRDGSVIGYEAQLYGKGHEKLISFLISAKLADDVIEGTVLDMTEKVVLEEQLRQAQKLEAVGTLAGGIAHDFNNLLTSILGNIAMVRRKIGDEHPVAKNLARAKQAGDRAAELVRHLLALGRKSSSQLHPLVVDDIVHEVISLLPETIDSRISIHADINSANYLVAADAAQLNQLLLNLCINACDSILDRLNATEPSNLQLGLGVTILTKPITIDEHTVGPSPKVKQALKHGKYVLIQVRDNGLGIPENIQQHIFEPFFTTKEIGKGTGLGLATAYNVVSQHHGFIDFQTEMGYGTTFSVYLPVAETAQLQQSPHSPTPPKTEGGKKTILLADDEEMIRDLSGEILTRAGYNVIAASDGQEAVDIHSEKNDEIQVVVLDQSMPRLTGTEALEKIRERNPNIRAILCSGYNVQAKHSDTDTGSAAAFLPKPFNPSELVDLVREVLDR